MHKTFLITKTRLDTLLLTSILPSLGIACAVISLIMGMCINKAFLITFVLFPLATVALLALCIFSPLKRYHKGVLSVLLLILFVVLFLGGNLFGTYVSLNRYKNGDVAVHYAIVAQYDDQMPLLNEIGEPDYLEYCNVHTRYYFFFPEADYLICRYTPEEYTLQKNSLEEKYTFQTETMYSLDYDFEAHTYSYVHPCNPAVILDGYHFRVLSTELGESHANDYPWQMNLIAYSDEKCEIIYLSYHHTDIDYHTSLTDFLHDECGWKHVR